MKNIRNELKVLPGGQDQLRKEVSSLLLKAVCYRDQDAGARLLEIDGILARRGNLSLAFDQNKIRSLP